ncbi:hypothetical protein LTR53_005485 [Teratosphaeriaceae sp. CCFEE 6253]|nr:hypothetical protein LTR53_005485 [Teratosphaeriaceae sp. CCFEE 6253]
MASFAEQLSELLGAQLTEYLAPLRAEAQETLASYRKNVDARLTCMEVAIEQLQWNEMRSQQASAQSLSERTSLQGNVEQLRGDLVKVLKHIRGSELDSKMQLLQHTDASRPILTQIANGTITISLPPDLSGLAPVRQQPALNEAGAMPVRNGLSQAPCESDRLDATAPEHDSEELYMATPKSGWPASNSRAVGDDGAMKSAPYENDALPMSEASSMTVAGDGSLSHRTRPLGPVFYGAPRQARIDGRILLTRRSIENLSDEGPTPVAQNAQALGSNSTNMPSAVSREIRDTGSDKRPRANNHSLPSTKQARHVEDEHTSDPLLSDCIAVKQKKMRVETSPSASPTAAHREAEELLQKFSSRKEGKGKHEASPSRSRSLGTGAGVKQEGDAI